MARESVNHAVGAYLRDLREDMDLTMDQVAAASDLSWSTVQRCETGTREVTVDVVGKILRGLGVPLTDAAWVLMRLGGYPESKCDKVQQAVARMKP